MMKASIGRLRRFALHKVDGKDKGGFLPTAQMDELAQAAKDMQDMRDCYDGLLSAAAATANSAYEFSESLGEMGSCLEKIAPHNDEESGKIFLMLGRVQFELQKLVDNYRTHILKTITHPSESLLNELRTVEDMKRQCDEKRDVYEYMMAHGKEKGRPKGGKGESLISHQIQTAHNEFHDEATLCIFRLKSLKQGQSRSLLTQAARHHAAQMYLFRNGLKSLEVVEQHVRVVAEKQHIDCELSVHGNEMEDSEDDGENDQYANEDGELSFDYRTSTQRVEVLSISRSSSKMDEGELSFRRSSATEYATVNTDQKEEPPRASSGDHKASSHSAPLFLERRSDPTEKSRQMHPSAARGSNTYVLPTPIDSRNPAFTRSVAPASNAKPTNHSGHIWHSSPLEQMKSGKDAENSNLSTRLPLPSADGLQISHPDASNASAAQKVTRYAFSGPLVSKPSSTKPVSSAETSSGIVSRLPVPQSSPPRVSPGASPPLASSPRVSELHELPRPPGNLAPPKRAKSPGLVGHSAPLTAWSQDIPAGNRGPLASTSVASPLPVPPLVVPRSFSIPSRNQRAMAQRVSKLLESPRVAERSEETASPPLTPMSLMNLRSPSPPLPQVAAAAAAAAAGQSGQIRGGS